MKNRKLKYSEEELEIIKKLYPSTTNKVIATWMPHSPASISLKAKRMGLSKTKEHILENCRNISLAQWQNEQTSSIARKTCFTKGHTPWNKGKKISGEHKSKLLRYTFIKGNTPHNELPIGSIRNINKFIEIKYENHKWKSLARYNWEQIHGEIPKGMCVFKIDGDNYNNDISNLCLVSRQDLAKLNRNHAKLTPELKEVQILINQIKQKTK